MTDHTAEPVSSTPAKRCPALYPSKDPTARIVHCELPAGHEGDHEEVSTESSWPACCPGETLRGDPHGMHTHDCPVYLANVAAWEASRPPVDPNWWPPQLPKPITRVDLDERVRAAYERGKAEGLRQATEGRGDSYARGVDRGFAEAVAALRDDARYEQWWSALPQEHPDYGYWSQHPRRQFADYLETVGPWEPAEQPDRDPLADDPVARRLGLIDAEGRTLCRCLAGDPACPIGPPDSPRPRATRSAKRRPAG